MKSQLCILLVLAIFELQKAACQDITGWFSIDCGTDGLGFGALLWFPDSDFTKTGINKNVPDPQPQLSEMRTLRYFPNRSDQNCYIVPSYMQTIRYIVRAGFYYGNYDGLSRPPTFDLHLNGRKWATVNTSSMGGPVYEEVMYVNVDLSGYISVCLAQTRDGEVPFISSLEVVALWTTLHPKMENKYTFFLVNRTNLGGDEVRYTGLLSDERYNRIWSRQSSPNYTTVPTLPDSLLTSLENDPPVLVLRDSIVPTFPAPITFILDLPSWLAPQQLTNYIVLYFSEIPTLPSPNDTRIMDIFVDGRMMITVGTPVGNCKVVTVYPVRAAGPKVNITLAKSKLSTMSPMISAMEVFTRTDGPDQTNGTQASGGNATRKYVFFLCVYLIHMLCLVSLL